MIEILQHHGLRAESSVIHLVLGHTFNRPVLIQPQMAGLPDCTCTS